MANPDYPEIENSYVAFQQANQDSPFPGTALDGDLANLKHGIDQTIDALKDVRRADGKLPNKIVDADAVADDLLIGLKTPVAWQPGANYFVLDTVYLDTTDQYGVYRCVKSHTSGLVFADDLAAGLWELIFDFGQVQEEAIAARDKAREWAVNAEDDPVETDPGNEFSALHHAAKADASATAASGSASAAASSATSASTSADEAAASAGTAEGAASTAQTSAGQAMTAANNAATSETNAAASAGAAADSADAAAASADEAADTLASALLKPTYDPNGIGLDVFGGRAEFADVTAAEAAAIPASVESFRAGNDLYNRVDAGDIVDLSADVYAQTADGAYWVRSRQSHEQGVFDFRDYVTLRQMHLIEQYDETNQDESANVTAFRTLFDEVLAWMQGGTYRAAKVKLPSGLIAVNDEIFSTTFTDAIYNTTGLNKFNSLSIMGGGPDDITVLKIKDWLAPASARNTERWAGQTVPQSVIRWEQAVGIGIGLTLKYFKIVGASDPATDPIGLWLSHGNKCVLEIAFENIRNFPYFIERLENSDIQGLIVEDCGYQPTLALGNGFIPAADLFSVTGTTLTRASGTFAFTADHVGKDIYIEGAGTTGEVFSTSIASLTSTTQVELADAVTTNVTDKHISFGPITGSMSSASSTLALTEDVPSAALYVGRMVIIPDAGSADTTEQSHLVTFITAKTGTSVTLMDAATNAVTDVPIICGNAGTFGRLEGASTQFNNDTHIRRGRWESAWNDNTGSTAFGALFQNCLGVYVDGKFHGVSFLFNNFAACESVLMTDRAQGLRFNRGTLASWGWSRTRGQIWCAGDKNNVDLSHVDVGTTVQGNEQALVYWAPKVANASSLLWGNFNARAGWPVDDQTDFRFGGAGALTDIYQAHPSFARGSSLQQDAGSWTPVPLFTTMGDAVFTVNVGQGIWKRSGRIVEIAFYLDMTTNAFTTASGSFRVSGLPFNVGTALSFFPCALGRTSKINIGGGAALTTVINLAAEFRPSGDEIGFTYQSDAGGVGALGSADIPASTTNIVVSGHGIYRL